MKQPWIIDSIAGIDGIGINKTEVKFVSNVLKKLVQSLKDKNIKLVITKYPYDR